ncbi:hypothetical protein N7478_007541 [Penicillium angulare]|uniref:uncharacterized protein n=1 Tax=Penicillium angulare TaxID=116970 RepID=UPI002542134A|nr:uncharacterized protein N7478_007541 [Penicillium angulare]KAJ5272416.1 hypothetical protein N7478_007541 [Penicillium angulare]
MIDLARLHVAISTSTKGITVVDEGSNLSPIFRWMKTGTDLVKANANPYTEVTSFTIMFGSMEFHCANSRSPLIHMVHKSCKLYAIRMHHGDDVYVLPESSAKEWRNLPREHDTFYGALSLYLSMRFKQQASYQELEECCYQTTGQEVYLHDMTTTSADAF